MRRVERLKQEASAIARSRFHLLGRWTNTLKHNNMRDLSTNYCKRCGGYVQVNSNPAPNDIDIGGPVMAGNCPAVDY